jgi:ABC-type phosphate transport system auxiliary subunit
MHDTIRAGYPLATRFFRAVPRLLAVVCAALLLSTGAAAQLLEKRVSPLNPLDRQYMDVQRELIHELTLRYYGTRCCRRESELEYLERLLEDQRVRPEQTRELQAMGVLLGDLLAAELDMHWVVYEDAKGRSRALQLGESDNFLFPVTMIARRREAGDTTPVAEIYRKAYEAIEAVRPPLPFQ